jgi:hypothetical protein
MSRTSSTAVKAVLAAGGDYNTRSNPDLAPYIEIASAWVDDLVAYAAANGLDSPGATRQELIERWLAAHAYKSSHQAYASKTTDGASASFQGKTGMYFEGTKYGQNAIWLDGTGYLSGGPTTADVEWLGKTFSDQLDYTERD